MKVIFQMFLARVLPAFVGVLGAVMAASWPVLHTALCAVR